MPVPLHRLVRQGGNSEARSNGFRSGNGIRHLCARGGSVAKSGDTQTMLTRSDSVSAVYSWPCGGFCRTTIHHSWTDAVEIFNTKTNFKEIINISNISLFEHYLVIDEFHSDFLFDMAELHGWKVDVKKDTSEPKYY